MTDFRQLSPVVKKKMWQHLKQTPSIRPLTPLSCVVNGKRWLVRFPATLRQKRIPAAPPLFVSFLADVGLRRGAT